MVRDVKFDIRADYKGGPAFGRARQDLASMGAGVKGLNAQLSQGANFIRSFGAGLVGGFGVQQLAQFVKQASAAGDAIGDLADQTGATAESIQILRYAAQQTGSSAEQMDAAIAKLAVNLGEAQKGSGDLKKLLDANGIALEDAAGKARPFNDILNDIIELVRRAPDDFRKLEVVTTAFGAKNDELKTTFDGGTAAVDAFGRELRDLDGIISDEGIDALGKMDAKFNEATASMEAALKRLVVATGPALQFIFGEVVKFANDLTTIAETIDLLLQGKFAEAGRRASTGGAAGSAESKRADELAIQIAEVQAERKRQEEEFNRLVEAGSLQGAQKLRIQEQINELKEREIALQKELMRLRPPGSGAAPYTTGAPSGAPTVTTETPTVVPTKADADAAKDAADARDDAAKAQEDAAEEYRRALEAGSEFAKRLADVPDQWQKLFYESAKRFGIDPNMLASIAWQESRFNPSAVSPAGARGLMQFMPGTAADFGINPMVPGQAVPAAAEYMKMLLDHYNGDPALALAAYNWGMGNVDAWVNAGMDPAAMPTETRGYLSAIMTPHAGAGAAITQFDEDLIKANADTLDAALQQTIDRMDELRGTAETVFSTIIDGLRNGASAGEIFQAVLAGILDDLASAASRQLTSALFGPTGTAQTGLLGSLFSPISTPAGSPGALTGLAKGGIMTSKGPLPLQRYQHGGIANHPQLAMFGEGSQSEAYVPLPDGRRIPVNLRIPQLPSVSGAMGVQQSKFAITVDVAGANGDAAIRAAAAEAAFAGATQAIAIAKQNASSWVMTDRNRGQGGFRGR